jgi:predicted negative regulator of RcsB-dependent stress response
MAYDLEEQEQLATLKEWWGKYGNPLTWLLILALAGYAAWNGWNYYQRNQAIQASQLYDELQKGVSAKDSAKVQRATADMKEKFGGTAYAEMSALTAAKYAFDAGDLPAAKTHLEWLVEHGSHESYKAVAKIRLAGILLDEKSYDEALKLLAGEFPVAFAAAVADRKGDILRAQDKTADARTAYETALRNMADDNPGRHLIQLKLDAIGGAVDKAAA